MLSGFCPGKVFMIAHIRFAYNPDGIHMDYNSHLKSFHFLQLTLFFVRVQ